MSNNKDTKKQKPRGTREHVESVKRNAAQAGKELDAEQVKSVGQLAQALGEISEGEALAHLDSRLAFVERQVERFAARKDEADRGVQGELAVMRARVEDALEAVGATAEQQREALASLEKRLAGVVADSERGSADVVTTLRKEIVAKVHETARRLEKLDARIRGEMAAFQEGFEERSRTLAQSVTDAKESFEDSHEEIQAELEASRSRIVEDMTIRLKDLESSLNKLAEDSVATVERAGADLKAFLEEAERRAAVADENASSVSESIQEELASTSDQLNRRLDEQLGEIKKQLSKERGRIEKQRVSLEANIEQRLSAAATTIDQALTSSLGEIRQLVEANEAKTLQEFEAHRLETSTAVDALRTQVAETFASHRTEVSEDLESSRAEVSKALTASHEEVTQTLSTNRAAFDAGLAGLRGSVEETLASQRAELEERLSGERRVLDEATAAERREMEGRLSEWGAEVRLESQRLREAVENRSKAMAEALDVVRKDLLTRIQASEEKTAGAAIRLQSLLDQQRREIVTDEEEWSGMLNEVGEDLSDLKIRVEELAGRVSAAEARRAAERGSSNASVESTSARLEALEQRVREVVEDMVAKQGTRLEMLASEVAGITETEVAAEEQLGAVDYLKRRVGEMAERLDEIVVKVNAIGRYVTKPGTAARLKAQAMTPPDITERLSAIEGAIEKLEAKEPVDAGISARLEALERAIADLSKAIADRPEPAPFVSAASQQPGSGIDLSVTVEEPPRKPVSGTILPSKKRRW